MKVRYNDYRDLTPTELLIARLRADGKTDGEIATFIGRSKKTVNAHLQNIHKKLQIHSHTEIAMKIIDLK
jgi:DNA-binding NarL/FixJ family response regulator